MLHVYLWDRGLECPLKQFLKYVRMDLVSGILY